MTDESDSRLSGGKEQGYAPLNTERKAIVPTSNVPWRNIMNAQTLRKWIVGLVVSLFISGLGFTPAVANATTYYCDPPTDGSSINLEDCNIPEEGEEPEPGQIVLVVGDLPVGGNAVREPVADHSWMNGFVFGALPTEPVADGEIYVAKGDILGNGRCAVTIFEAGDSVEIFSEGTWQLVRIYNGSADDRMAEALFVAEKAQREVGGAQFCPFVAPEDLVDPYADLTAVENGTDGVPVATEEANNTPAEPTATPDDETDLTGANSDNANNGNDGETGSVTTESLGQNVWEGEQLVLPDPVPAGSWLVLKGDADPARGGACSILAFGSGESPSGYSGGTFDAFLLSGGDDATYLVQVESMSTDECPVVRRPNGA